MSKLTPVTFPPGRLRLATRPNLTGSPPIDEDNGNRRGRSLGRSADGRYRRRRSPRHAGEPSRLRAPVAVRFVRPPSGIRSRRSDPRQSLASFSPCRECGHHFHVSSGDAPLEKPNHRHRCLLRACRHRPAPPRRRAAYELPPPHSITSSARASSEGGSSMPSALAVRRLMTSSNLVGCSTGMSLGLAPRRIRSTKSAARRYSSMKSDHTTSDRPPRRALERYRSPAVAPP